MRGNPFHRIRIPAVAGLLAGLTACAPSAERPAGGQRPGRVALVIGINRYGPEWPDLVSARPDAEAMARVLAERYGFETRRLLDGAATRAALIEAIEQIGRLSAETTVIIFYAGHGILDEDGGEGYWIPFGAVRKEDGIPHRDVIDRLVAAVPRQVLLISDACFSGALLGRRLWEGGGAAGAEAGRPAKYAIGSGDLAPVPDAGGTHSAFAQALLEALEHPSGNELSVSDLVRALDRRLRRLTGQVVRAGPLAPETDGAFVLRNLE